jgi:hypothetical protein
VKMCICVYGSSKSVVCVEVVDVVDVLEIYVNVWMLKCDVRWRRDGGYESPFKQMTRNTGVQEWVIGWYHIGMCGVKSKQVSTRTR